MSEQDEAKSVKPTADNKKSAAAALFLLSVIQCSANGNDPAEGVLDLAPLDAGHGVVKHL